MKTNRRDFLKAVGGIGLFSIVPSSVLGGRGRVAPSDQLTKGIIGVGGIGRSSYHFTSDKYCRLVAMCDVDSKHLEQAKAEAKEKIQRRLCHISRFPRSYKRSQCRCCAYSNSSPLARTNVY